MLTIDLQPITKQDIKFVADNQQYDCRVWFDGDDMMFMDVTINGTLVAPSCPCLVGIQVLQFAYLEGAGGNFFFTTASGNNPTYKNFGAGDVLLYASAAEMAQARALNAAALTAITLASNQAA